MTVVVDDTSPLNYLVLIEAIDLLPRLYRRVLIPQEVFQKLREPGAPPPVSAWIDEPPDWLEVRLAPWVVNPCRSEEHTSELQSRLHLVCRLLLEKKKINQAKELWRL